MVVYQTYKRQSQQAAITELVLKYTQSLILWFYQTLLNSGHFWSGAGMSLRNNFYLQNIIPWEKTWTEHIFRDLCLFLKTFSMPFSFIERQGTNEILYFEECTKYVFLARFIPSVMIDMMDRIWPTWVKDSKSV